MLAKARVDVRYMGYDLKALDERLKVNPDKINRFYRLYAQALIAYELKNYQKAHEYLNNLNLNDNIFVIDLKKILISASGNKNKAVNNLLSIYKRRPDNEAVVANLANALNENSQSKKAIVVLKVISKTPQ